MKRIVIEANNSIYEQITVFLKKLPKNLIKVYVEDDDKSNKNLSKKAFGILKGKIKDPVAWQKDIREENDRDIYKNFR